jgi:hypothetical protein
MFLPQVVKGIGDSQRCGPKKFFIAILYIFSLSIKKCNIFLLRPPERTAKLQKMPPALQRKQSALQYYTYLRFLLLFFFIFKIGNLG